MLNLYNCPYFNFVLKIPLIIRANRAKNRELKSPPKKYPRIFTIKINGIIIFA